MFFRGSQLDYPCFFVTAFLTGQHETASPWSQHAHSQNRQWNSCSQQQSNAQYDGLKTDQLTQQEALSKSHTPWPWSDCGNVPAFRTIEPAASELDLLPPGRLQHHIEKITNAKSIVTAIMKAIDWCIGSTTQNASKWLVTSWVNSVEMVCSVFKIGISNELLYR